MLLPMVLHSSPMVTGFGAVALKLPLKRVLVMASTNKATRSSLHGHTACVAAAQCPAEGQMCCSQCVLCAERTAVGTGCLQEHAQ